jgi:uncharacterized membrane protein (DUF4010 family)
MDTFELFQRLSVALGIGLLVGLERGWQARAESEGERSAGLRTHTLAALLGGIWGAIAQRYGEGGATALGLAFVAFGAAVTLFRYREVSHDRTFGATTVVAAMLAFTLGAFAVLGDMQVAAAAGVVVAALLALKAWLHDWVRRLTWAELRSGLVLLAMTVIVLPLLPDRPVDPWGAVNPYSIWLLTVMIAAISFGGYVAIRLAGDQAGIVVSSIAGGLASSTAVTVTMARLAKEHPDRSGVLLAGVLVSGATMMARVLVVAGVVNAALIEPLAVPLGLAGAVLAGGGVFLLLRHAKDEQRAQKLELGNPLDLATVLKFGALLTLITVLAKLATATAGSSGAFMLAALSGLADVDAITLSMARSGAQEIGRAPAAAAIAIAVGVNTLTKAAIGWSVGGSRAGRLLLGISVLAIAAGAAGVFLSGGLRS